MRLSPLLILLAVLPLHAGAQEYPFSCTVPWVWGTNECGKAMYTVPAGKSITIRIDGPAFNEGSFCATFHLTDKAGATLKSDIKICQGETHVVGTGKTAEVKLVVSPDDLKSRGSTVTGAVSITDS